MWSYSQCWLYTVITPYSICYSVCDISILAIKLANALLALACDVNKQPLQLDIMKLNAKEIGQCGIL